MIPCIISIPNSPPFCFQIPNPGVHKGQIPRPCILQGHPTSIFGKYQFGRQVEIEKLCFDPYNFRITIRSVDFQKSPSSDFIWRGTSRDFVAHCRPLRGQTRHAPLAKRSTCSKSIGSARKSEQMKNFLGDKNMPAISTV